MAQIDNSVTFLEQVATSVERGSDTHGFGSDEERFWLELAQIQATAAVAAALIAIHDTIARVGAKR